MDKGAGLLIPDIPVPPKADPRLKLLHELEPRYRVFISNLTVTLSRQPSPPIPTTSRPGRFWDDVFIDSRKPWRSFMESLLWHLVAVLIVWATSPGGVLQKTPLQQRRPFKGSYIAYYAAARSAPPPKRTAARYPERSRPAPQKALSVAREHRQSHGDPAAPDVKLSSHSRTPDLSTGSGPAPAVPLAATGRAHLNLPANWTSVVAPPPDLSRAGRHTLGLPQATVVAPAPDIGTVADQRPLAVPNAAVVAPPPTVQGWVRKIENLFGEVSSSGTSGQVVPPPPSVQGTDGAAGSRVSSLPGSGSQVIPPPPSVQSADNGAGGRMGSLAAGGTQVVPPPPAVQGTGEGAGGRLGSLSPVGRQVVPPPPSVSGVGASADGRAGSLAGVGAQVVAPPPTVSSTGRGGGSGRIASLGGVGSPVVPPPPSVQGTDRGSGGRNGSLAGVGTQVVPPPPSVQGTGSGGGGRLGSLSGSGTQVVPPPPSVQGTGNGGGGRMGSLSGSGAQVVPPPPSTQGAGEGGGGTRMASLSGAPDIPAPTAGAPGGGSVSTGPLQQMDDLPANSPPAADNPSGPPAEDLPLSLVSLALPTQGSSFFSNYEVFIAKHRIAKGKTEFIKLVYVFLPYQRRLSQYIADNAKVYTLRVIRDQTCDETLMQMTWPDADQDHPDALSSADGGAMSSSDRNAKLPCYRTTADDYQRALERGR